MWTQETFKVDECMCRRVERPQLLPYALIKGLINADKRYKAHTLMQRSAHLVVHEHRQQAAVRGHAT